MKKNLKKHAAVLITLSMLFSSFLSAFAASPDGYGYENGKMFNSFVEYVVDGDGIFTIGTTYGNLTNPNDDFKKLLFGHPGPWSSFTTIKIDGVNNYFQAQSISQNASVLSTKATQKINMISVEQDISIVTNSNSEKADTVQIKYTTTNQDLVPHSVGTRIMMDTMLGNNDAAPFRIPGYGAVTKELELSGENIPEYWQAFDSLTTPSVIGQGTLLRTDNKPDKVQFTNWGRASGTMWDLTVNTSSNTDDSAVSVFWNPRELLPGQSRTYVTYYGLSEFIQDMAPPIGLTLNRVSSIEATPNGYFPNPIKISGFLNNIGTAPAQNVRVKINLNNGLDVVNGSRDILVGSLAVGATRDFYFNVILPEFQSETTLTYSIEVTADNTQSKVLSNTFTVPALVIGDDHSDKIDRATVISQLNKEVNGIINKTGDVDCFKFVPSESGVYELESTGTTDLYGQLMGLFDNDINKPLLVNSNNDIGKFNLSDNYVNTNFRIIQYMTSGKPYYLKVMHNNSGTGNYKIIIKKWSASSLPPLENKPVNKPAPFNGTVDNATQLVLGAEMDGEIKSNPEVGNWYKIKYLPATGILYIDMYIDDGADLDLELYDSKLTPLNCSVSGYPYEYITVDLSELNCTPKDLYLRVRQEKKEPTPPQTSIPVLPLSLSTA